MSPLKYLNIHLQKKTAMNKDELTQEMISEYKNGWGRTAMLIFVTAFTFVAACFFVVAVMRSVVMFLIDLIK